MTGSNANAAMITSRVRSPKILQKIDPEGNNFQSFVSGKKESGNQKTLRDRMGI